MPNAKVVSTREGKENLIRLSRSSSSAAATATATVAMAPPSNYEVFLSFRGKDTRNNFTSHLHAGLCRKNIETFIDDRLERGDDVSEVLNEAIGESLIYVIIFSENYASSSWCLDELAKILECKVRYGRDVIPVFYKVEPSTVRYQTGSYADAFVKHEKRFSKDVTQRWKVALTEAAGISGWDSDTTRKESVLVDGIVEDILGKLNCSFSSNDDKGIIGIGKHIEKIQSLLKLESGAVRIIGIWGMGGMGKTTLARALYDKLAIQFSSRSLISIPQEEIDRDGIVSLRKKYLSELGFSDERLKGAKVLLILDNVKDSDQLEELIGGRENFGQGSRIIVTSRDKQVLWNAEEGEIYQVTKMSDEDSLRLFRLRAFKPNSPVEVNSDLVKKVLQYAQGVPLALDVLSRLLCGRAEKAWKSQLQKLEKSPHDKIFNALKLSYDGLDGDQKDIFLDIVCFYVGELEDITLDLLDGCGFFADIEMDVLKDRGLISVLDGKIVVHDLMLEMGKKIVRQQCGNNDPGEIYHVLRTNKDTDATQFQCIALDLSKIKEDQLHPEIFKKMPNLRILYFSKYKYSLFGQEESNVNLIPTFLASLPDGLKILCWEGFPLRYLPLGSCRKNLVKLYMRNSYLEQLWEDDQELQKLKRLDLSSSSNLIQIPDLSMFPNIEKIILSGCTNLTQVNSKMELPKLKKLDLSSSSNLIQISDLSMFPNIEEIIISGCKSLTQVNSKRELQKLKRLDLSSSSNLIQIPDLSKFPNIGEIILSGCTSLAQVNSQRDLPNLKKLDFSYSSNLILIPDLSEFPNIVEIYLNNCGSLTRVYSSSLLSKLKCLWLNGCVELTSLSLHSNILSRSSGLVGLYNCCKLETFSIYGTEVVEVFSGAIELYDEARCLDEKYSTDLDSFRKSMPSRLSHELCWLDLGECRSLTNLPINLWKLKLLRRLYLTCCWNLKKIPEIKVSRMENLVALVLYETEIKELPSSLDRLVGLEELTLMMCKRLKTIPSSIWKLAKLRKLRVSNCESLETLPINIFKWKLTELYLCGFSQLDTLPKIAHPAKSFARIDLESSAIRVLPSSLDHLVGLEELNLNGCRRLETIPSSIGRLSKLCKLRLTSCESLDTLPSSIFKLKLTELDLNGCSNIKTISEILEPAESFAHIKLTGIAIKELPSSLDCLVGLQTLSLNGCYDLGSLPNNISNLNLLSELDCSSCGKLTEIPNDIGRLSSLRNLSLAGTAIVKLPKSIARLSSLESLKLDYCVNLQFIPQLPPFLKELSAMGCPSIRRVMPNSRFKLPSDSKKGTFEFHFTNNGEQDPSGHRDVVADARLRFTEDAYSFVFYCFPGSAVPDWFPHRAEGNLVSVDKDSLKRCNDNKLIGFAMCIVLPMPECEFIDYRIRYGFGGRSRIIHDDRVEKSVSDCCGQMRREQRDHTFLWTYYLTDPAMIDQGIFHAHNFSFDIACFVTNDCYRFNGYDSDGDGVYLTKNILLKECGVCPLYTKEKR